MWSSLYNLLFEAVNKVENKAVASFGSFSYVPCGSISDIIQYFMYNCFTILPVPHCSKHCNSTHHSSTVTSFTITFVSLKFIRGSILSLCQTLLSEWTSVVMIRISLGHFSKIINYKRFKLCRGRTVLQLILTANQPNVDLLFFKLQWGMCIHRHAHTPSLTTLYHFKPVIIMGLIQNRSSVSTFIYHCCT